MPRLYVALIHYPVINKNGERVTSAVTNLDVHDIARLVKTYGGMGYYVVTPLTDQQVLVERIISHWTSGIGGENHPKRKSALELVHVVDSLEAACEDIKLREGALPKIVATSARTLPQSIGFDRLREEMAKEAPVLLIFGTAWGLAEDMILRADYTLVPVAARTGYNHLSVRSAASIVIDRLLGD